MMNYSQESRLLTELQALVGDIELVYAEICYAPATGVGTAEYDALWDKHSAKKMALYNWIKSEIEKGVEE